MFIKKHKKSIIVLTTTAMMALSAATAFAATGGEGVSLTPAAAAKVNLSNVTKGTFSVATGTLKAVKIVKNGDGFVVVQSADGQPVTDLTTAAGPLKISAEPLENIDFLKVSGPLNTADLDLKDGTFTVVKGVKGIAPQVSGGYTAKTAPAKQ